jgi:hypothetical protein
MNKPDNNGRTIRWLFLLQQFDLTILDKPGKKIVFVYFLSRLTNYEDGDMINDHFLYEYLFTISE